MTSLHMIEIRPDIGALLHFLRDQGLETTDDADLGYGVHAWFGAAFGEQAPKPWRLFMDRKRPARILGYSDVPADILRERISDFASPSVLAVCTEPEVTILSKPMPEWGVGRRLNFDLQCCPVGRKAGSGIEKDLFLIHGDRDETAALSRAEVYCEWARKRLEHDVVTSVTSISLAGFRLVRQMRKKQGSNRDRSRLTRPLAMIQGRLVINDPWTAISTRSTTAMTSYRMSSRL
jgi:CRISPR system Cascade subunit CasE